MLSQVIGTLRGNVATVRAAMSILDTLEMSPDEREQVGMSDLPAGGAQWSDREHRWEIDLSIADVEFVRKAVETFDGWPVGMGNQVVELVEMLESSE
jgi:hypothetical protein